MKVHTVILLLTIIQAYGRNIDSVRELKGAAGRSSAGKGGLSALSGNKKQCVDEYGEKIEGCEEEKLGIDAMDFLIFVSIFGGIFCICGCFGYYIYYRYCQKGKEA